MKNALRCGTQLWRQFERSMGRYSRTDVGTVSEVPTELLERKVSLFVSCLESEFCLLGLHSYSSKNGCAAETPWNCLEQFAIVED